MISSAVAAVVMAELAGMAMAVPVATPEGSGSSSVPIDAGVSSAVFPGDTSSSIVSSVSAMKLKAVVTASARAARALTATTLEMDCAIVDMVSR